MCKALMQCGLCAFPGLLGYIKKDHDEPHSDLFCHGVNAAELQKGHHEHALWGSVLSKSVLLSCANMMDRLELFAGIIPLLLFTARSMWCPFLETCFKLDNTCWQQTLSCPKEKASPYKE